MKTKINITREHVVDKSKECAITPYIFATYISSYYMYDKSFTIGISWGHHFFYIDFNIYKI